MVLFCTMNIVIAYNRTTPLLKKWSDYLKSDSGIGAVNRHSENRFDRGDAFDNSILFFLFFFLCNDMTISINVVSVILFVVGLVFLHVTLMT